MDQLRTGSGEDRRPWLGRLFAVVVVALLAQMAVAMTTAARDQSQTVDEGVYVAAGAVYLREGSLRFNPEHPPMTKLLAAAGLSFADDDLVYESGYTGSEWRWATRLLYQKGNDPQHLLWLARLPMIVLTLLFGLVVFFFARDLTGPVGGLIALTLYAFSPDVIANGSLVSVDLPAAGFLLTTLWLLWRAQHRPWLYFPLAALALGGGLATKMNLLAAVPVAMLLTVLSYWRFARSRHRPARVLLTGALIAVGLAVLAVATVWVSYLVVDPQLRWTRPPDLPVPGGLTGAVINWLPFPGPFRDGLRLQVALEASGDHTGFLLGERYAGSKWYYLPAALLIKTPLGALVLWIAGAVTMLAVPRLRPAAVYLLAPALIMLGVAMTGSRDLGVRYALFVPFLLAVAAAAVVRWRWRWAPVLTGILLLAVAVSSLRTYPLYLPYSNEAFGGPSRTYQNLSDSNVDWGQDLPRLAARLEERYPGEHVWFHYKGRGAPTSYGITSTDPVTVPPEQVRGLLVISATRVSQPVENLQVLIDSSRLIDEVGHSILIYRRP